MPYHYGPPGFLEMLPPGANRRVNAFLNWGWEVTKWAVPVAVGAYLGYEMSQAADAFSKYIGFHDSIRIAGDWIAGLSSGVAATYAGNLALNTAEDMHYEYALARRQQLRAEIPAETAARAALAATNPVVIPPQPPAPAAALRVLPQQYRNQL